MKGTGNACNAPLPALVKRIHNAEACRLSHYPEKELSPVSGTVKFLKGKDQAKVQCCPSVATPLHKHLTTTFTKHTTQQRHNRNHYRPHAQAPFKTVGPTSHKSPLPFDSLRCMANRRAKLVDKHTEPNTQTKRGQVDTISPRRQSCRQEDR
jgi:hypothetical protein